MPAALSCAALAKSILYRWGFTTRVCHRHYSITIDHSVSWGNFRYNKQLANEAGLEVPKLDVFEAIYKDSGRARKSDAMRYRERDFRIEKQISGVCGAIDEVYTFSNFHTLHDNK
jgi:hypothetical protein